VVIFFHDRPIVKCGKEVSKAAAAYSSSCARSPLRRRRNASVASPMTNSASSVDFESPRGEKKEGEGEANFPPQSFMPRSLIVISRPPRRRRHECPPSSTLLFLFVEPTTTELFILKKRYERRMCPLLSFVLLCFERRRRRRRDENALSRFLLPVRPSSFVHSAIDDDD